MSSHLLPLTALEQLCGVAARFRSATEEISNRRCGSDESFNLFTTLLKEDDEVRLHTRFIHCLLNTSGLHGQGSRFLDLFFETLAEHPAKGHNGESISVTRLDASTGWKASREANCHPYGKIDLLLEGRDFCVAIENKLNAAEQERQIECYGDYLNDRWGDKSHLFFLTKHGHASATHAGRSYFRISYFSHILPWLEKCSKETQKLPSLYHALKQYEGVVRQVVGKTTEAETMSDISNYIGQQTDLIRYRVQIKKALDEARAGFLNRMAEDIASELKGAIRLSARPELPGFGAHSEGTLVLQLPPDSPLQQMDLKVCVQNWVEGESLLVGIETNPPLEGDALSILKLMDDFLAKHTRSHPEYHKHLPTKLWPTGWHDLEKPFDDDKIANLLKEGHQEFASRICRNIRQHIQLLEDAYRYATEKASPTPLP